MKKRTDPVRIGARRIGADFDPRLLELKLDVVFAHEKVDRLDAAPFAEDELHRRVEIICAHHLSDL